MPPAECRLAAREVARRFGYRPVLRDVSVELHTGDVVVLLGANGAGKTTLLRVLAGLLQPSSGTIERVDRIGILGHEAGVYDALTAAGNLSFFARIEGLDPAVGTRLLERLGLADRAADQAGTFSRGMIQRLGIARALLAAPGVLLLDEPLTGLDRASTEVVRDVLLEQRAAGTAMMIASHRPEALSSLVTRTVTLDGGVLVSGGPAHA